MTERRADARAVTSPSYLAYTGSQAVSIVGTTMGFTALYWLTIKLARGDAVLLAALVAAQFIPMLLVSRRAGIIVSRHKAARVVTVTQSALAAGSLALALPLLAGWTSIWYLCVVSFATGCVQAVDVPGRQTLMLDLVGTSELRQGASLYAAATGLAKIVGPALAGVLIAVSGEAAVFLADAVSYLFVLGVLLWLSRQRGPNLIADRDPAAAGSEVPATARRFRWVLDLPGGVRLAVAMALLIGGFGIQFEVTNPLMATHVFHLSSLGFGLLGTFMACGGIAGNVFSSRREDPGKLEFLAWASVFGAAEVIAAVMPVIWAYDLAMVVIGAAIQLFAVSATVYVQQATPAAQRGHALSAYNAGFLGFVPAGSFLVAGIAVLAGPRWALVGPGAVILACAGLAFARRSPANLCIMRYRRMPIEVESPEQLGYSAITNNLSESSVSDRRLSDLGLDIDLDDLVLCYGDHLGDPALREAIAAQGDGLHPDDVLVTPGAAAALFCTSTALLQPGDHIVVVRTNYATNLETPRAIGADVDVVDLRYEDGWAFDLDAIESRVRPGHTKLISVTCPHNPTGALLDLAGLRRLAALAERSGAVLLVDETYRDLTHAQRLPMAATLTGRAISIASMSKAYGLPGLRIGWAVTTDPDLRELLLAAKEQIVICGATIDEHIAGRVLAERDQVLPPILADVRERLAIVQAWMDDQAAFEWVPPRGGVIGLARFRPEVEVDTDAFYRHLLADHGTYVGPGHWFEISDRYFRLGYGWPATAELSAGLAGLTAAARQASR